LTGRPDPLRLHRLEALKALGETTVIGLRVQARVH